MTPARLRLDAVACVRGGRLLFEALSLDLAPGGAALVRGANGAGKSSLLRLAAGLLPAAAGSVHREGRLALADENMALDRQASLTRALLFWAMLDGRGVPDVVRGLEAMGLTHLADVPVRMLSTGQRKRATLARVIASDAPIWLLDEPANGLDTDALDRLAAAMAAHRAEGGIVFAAAHQGLGLEGPEKLDLSTPFVSSEVETGVRAKPRTEDLGSARSGPSTSLGTNGEGR